MNLKVVFELDNLLLVIFRKILIVYLIGFIYYVNMIFFL